MLGCPDSRMTTAALYVSCRRCRRNRFGWIKDGARKGEGGLEWTERMLRVGGGCCFGRMRWARTEWDGGGDACESHSWGVGEVA